MRNISKSKFKIYRQDYNEPNDFYSLASLKKQEVRQHLVMEQGYLCCYCMMRIKGTANDTNVEHNKPRSLFPELIFDYSNLLAGCTRTAELVPQKKRSYNPTEKNRIYRHRTCDTAKGEKEISKNPALHDVEVLIKYEIDGRISSSDLIFHKDLVETLNLNKEDLVNARKSLVKTIGIGIERKYPGKSPNESQLRNELKRFLTPNSNGELPEFSGIAVFYLEKKLKRINPNYSR